MDLADRFKKCKERITKLGQEKVRLETKRDESHSRIEQIETEIREAGFEPDKLDEAITEKKEALEKAEHDLQEQVTAVEQGLSKVEDNVRSAADSD